jgi:hypothetical protein
MATNNIKQCKGLEKYDNEKYQIVMRNREVK